jgi:hypothetical protein
MKLCSTSQKSHSELPPHHEACPNRGTRLNGIEFLDSINGTLSLDRQGSTIVYAAVAMPLFLMLVDFHWRWSEAES